ncbi:MAG: hypothetical protein QNJ22_22570 [Desulfosarcinaceae bacterium]|nr:hypothetical protein [Desulfosarcinaceae bacterium]
MKQRKLKHSAARHCATITATGHALFLQGDPADEMSLIQRGRVKLTKVLEIGKRRPEHYKEIESMSYFLKVTESGEGNDQLQKSYDMLQAMFQTVPKVFVAQSIRPDLLAPIVQYVNRLMIETHALPRRTKELIAAHVSKLNACAY